MRTVVTCMGHCSELTRCLAICLLQAKEEALTAREAALKTAEEKVAEREKAAKEAKEAGATTGKVRRGRL